MTILFVDACPRVESRTRVLANCLLNTLNDSIETLSLSCIQLPDLNNEMVEKRNKDCKKENFMNSYYDYAKQFSKADIIVIAAPYWDLSFPAILKKYLETITVSGITFKYSNEGIPIGLCKAKKLYYITTSGGPILNDAYGFGYVKALATGMYGIKECICFKAEELDIVGNNPDQIVNEVKQKILGR